MPSNSAPVITVDAMLGWDEEHETNPGIFLPLNNDYDRSGFSKPDNLFNQSEVTVVPGKTPAKILTPRRDYELPNDVDDGDLLLGSVSFSVSGTEGYSGPRWFLAGHD